MLLADAEKLAKELMTQFGLMGGKPPVVPEAGIDWSWYARQWHFEFDDAKRRFGCCHLITHKITLSRELTIRNEREQVEDVIRHEIAHALCPRKAGHGPLWKAMCAKVGAKPERCYDSEEVDAPKGDWSATCGVCGKVYHKFRRPMYDPGHERYCSDKGCKRKPLPYIQGVGRFHPMRKLVWRHKNAMPDPHEEQRRKAVEATKARLRAQEPEMLQCAKCDMRVVSPVAGLTLVSCPGGELKPEKALQAEKEQLKKRIEELEKRVGIRR